MKSSKIRFKKIIAIIIVLILFAIFWVVYSKLLVVNKVIWNLNGVDCVTTPTLDKTINLKGSPLFKLSNNVIEKNIVSKYPCIKSVVIIKELNGNLTINLSKRQPFLNILAYQQSQLDILNNLEASSSTQSALVDYSLPNSSSTSFLADDQGVLYQLGNGALPYLYIADSKFKIGDPLGSVLFQTVKAVITFLPQLITENYLNITSLDQVRIKADGNNLIVLTDPLLLFSLEDSKEPNNKDIYNSLISLQLILKTAKMENKAIKSVDLRFDKPVVEYKL